MANLSLSTNLVDPPPMRTIYMKHPLAHKYISGVRYTNVKDIVFITLNSDYILRCPFYSLISYKGPDSRKRVQQLI